MKTPLAFSGVLRCFYRQLLLRVWRLRGFNLIEAAIALGVIGTVLSGLWIAAGTVLENFRVNKTVLGITQIAKNTQDFVGLAELNAISGSSEVTIESSLIATTRIPQDWVENGTAKHPFGGNLRVRLYAPSKWMAVELVGGNITKSACIKILVKLTTETVRSGSVSFGTGSHTGDIKFVQINYPVSEITTFPIVPDIAESVCNPNNNILYIYYGFTRN